MPGDVLDTVGLLYTHHVVPGDVLDAVGLLYTDHVVPGDVLDAVGLLFEKVPESQQLREAGVDARAKLMAGGLRSHASPQVRNAIHSRLHTPEEQGMMLVTCKLHMLSHIQTDT